MHAIGMFDGDAIMICSSAITSLENTTKNIYLSGTLLDEFTSIYYNDKNDTFGMLFQQHKAIAVNNIYRPSIVE